MPVMDGFTYVKRFRAYEVETNFVSERKCNNRNGKFLVIGMSANSEDLIKEDALAAGIDGFITKPFVYDDFWNAVRSYIAVRIL